MNKQEFFQFCAKNTKKSVQDIKMEFTAVPCSCGDEVCNGWQLNPKILSQRRKGDKE